MYYTWFPWQPLQCLCAILKHANKHPIFNSAYLVIAKIHLLSLNNNVQNFNSTKQLNMKPFLSYNLNIARKGCGGVYWTAS